MHPGTDDAAVPIRVGETLLHLHQEQTAEHFLRAWAEGAEAAKALPMQADWRPVRTLRGMPDPAVAAHAAGRPASNVLTGRARALSAGPARATRRKQQGPGSRTRRSRAGSRSP